MSLSALGPLLAGSLELPRVATAPQRVAPSSSRSATGGGSSFLAELLMRLLLRLKEGVKVGCVAKAEARRAKRAAVVAYRKKCAMEIFILPLPARCALHK